jgi:hypothetical protein
VAENRCKAQRPAAGWCCCYHAAFTAALLTLCMRARSWILALDFFA